MWIIYGSAYNNKEVDFKNKTFGNTTTRITFVLELKKRS